MQLIWRKLSKYQMIIYYLVLFFLRHTIILVSISKIIKSCKDKLQWGGSNGNRIRGGVILHVEVMLVILVTDGLGLPYNMIPGKFFSVTACELDLFVRCSIQLILFIFNFKFEVWKYKKTCVMKKKNQQPKPKEFYGAKRKPCYEIILMSEQYDTKFPWG